MTLTDSVPHGAQAGIVILKKIPRGQQRPPDHLKAEGSTIPDFKPIKSTDSEYSFPNVVSKFFSASSSLQPDGPPTASQTNNDDEFEGYPPKEHKTPEYSGPPQVQENDSEPSKPTYTYHPSLANQKPNTFSTVDTNSPEKYKDSTKPARPSEIEIIRNALKQAINSQQNRPETLINNQPNLPEKPEDLPSVDSFGPYPGFVPPEFGIQNQGYTLPSFPVPPINLENLQSQNFDPRHNPFQTNTQLNSQTPINMKPPRAVSGINIPPPFTGHVVHDGIPYPSQKDLLKYDIIRDRHLLDRKVHTT